MDRLGETEQYTARVWLTRTDAHLQTAEGQVSPTVVGRDHETQQPMLPVTRVSIECDRYRMELYFTCLWREW